MIYCFDIDGTICSVTDKNGYMSSVPFIEVIQEINRLYNEGNTIKIMSARGSVSNIDWYTDTKNQLNKWGLKYHELIMNKKPHADLFVDDKAINVKEWRKNIIQKKGVIAGCFDVIHPGYIHTFEIAKKYCDHLTVLLHENPATENLEKYIPILSVSDRKQILLSLQYVDSVIVYETENDLLDILINHEIDIRFLGDDYKNKKKFTGYNLDIDIKYIDRNHDWSSTKFKNMIHNQISEKESLL